MVGHMVLVHGIEVRVLVGQPTRDRLSRTRRVDSPSEVYSEKAYLLRVVARTKIAPHGAIFVDYLIPCFALQL